MRRGCWAFWARRLSLRVGPSAASGGQGACVDPTRLHRPPRRYRRHGRTTHVRRPRRAGDGGALVDNSLYRALARSVEEHRQLRRDVREASLRNLVERPGDLGAVLLCLRAFRDYEALVEGGRGDRVAPDDGTGLASRVDRGMGIPAPPSASAPSTAADPSPRGAHFRVVKS